MTTLTNHIVPVYVDDGDQADVPYRERSDFGYHWEETFCAAPVHPHQGDCASTLDSPYCAALWVHDGPCQFLTSDAEEAYE